MIKRQTADAMDADLLGVLIKSPEATNIAISETTGLARNTDRPRLAHILKKTL